MSDPLRLALVEPDIAGNVGTLLRLGACLGVPVDLVEPMGFPFGDRAMMRAGMDYVDRATVARHADWDAFRAATPGRLVLLTTHGATPLWQARFRPGDVLILGSESHGAPPYVHDAAALRVAIPTRPGCRSLNVAAAGAMALGEAVRQVRYAGA